MITQEINVYMDVTDLPEIRMVAGDVGRMIYPYVYTNRNADEPLDLTTYTLRIILIKPDKTFVIADFYDGAIELPEQAGAVTGRGYYQLRVSKSGEEIYSGQGDFIVDDYILNDSMVESIAEVDGYQFPDDFLTQGADVVSQEELEETLEDYATKTYVDDAIAGASSYMETILFNDDNPSYFTPSSPKTIILNDDYTNYDILVIDCCENSFPTARSQIWLLTSMILTDPTLYNATISTIYNNWSSPAFTVIDGTHFSFKGYDSSTPMRLYKITGIKW